MTENAIGTSSDQAEQIQNQINQALQELDQIRNTRQVITDPEAMEAVERTIVQATDKIAALMTALKVEPSPREAAGNLLRKDAKSISSSLAYPVASSG